LCLVSTQVLKHQRTPRAPPRPFFFSPNTSFSLSSGLLFEFTLTFLFSTFLFLAESYRNYVLPIGCLIFSFVPPLPPGHTGYKGKLLRYAAGSFLKNCPLCFPNPTLFFSFSTLWTGSGVGGLSLSTIPPPANWTKPHPYPSPPDFFFDFHLPTRGG